MSKYRKTFSSFHFVIEIPEFGMLVFFGQPKQLLWHTQNALY